MSKELSITQAHIEDRIFTIRGMQVMLDRDLAEMYQVETKYVNRAMKRNPDRFPESFAFQLTEKEWEFLRCQSGTLDSGRGQYRKYLPFVFSEQGVAMLSAVLQSSVAIKVSVQIINAFVAMRKIISNHSSLLQRMDGLERRQLETDQKVEQIFKVMEGNTIPAQGVFFDGQVFDAYELASKIIRTAKLSIVLIDNYIDESTFTHLAKKKKEVSVVILTKSAGKQQMLDLQKANEQYGNFSVKTFTQSHDRFLIIDGTEIYHLGASLKDLGKKWFAFSKMGQGIVSHILSAIPELNH